MERTLKTALFLAVSTLALGSAALAQRAYVPNLSSNNLSVVDVPSRKVIATIATGKRPTAVALASGGEKLLVTNQESFTLQIFDTKTLKIIKAVLVGDTPYGVAVTPDGLKAYVA